MGHLPTKLSTPPMTAMFLSSGLTLHFRSFNRPEVGRPPFRGVVHRQVGVFFKGGIYPCRFLSGYTLVLRGAVLCCSLHVRVVNFYRFVHVDRQFTGFI